MSSNSAFDDRAHDEKGALLMRKLAGLPDMRLGISWDILSTPWVLTYGACSVFACLTGNTSEREALNTQGSSRTQ
jgi:hypothetical protein